MGTRPGEYQFNSLEYSGALYAGASFYVDYLGYPLSEGEFYAPVMALHFGYSEFEALEKYTAWLDERGFSTQRPYSNASWHRMPVFCGWAEQTSQANQQGMAARDLATQDNYEKWIRILEERMIPTGTIVIDDKWQKDYGTFEIDLEKWPDLPGFIARQHEKGRRVLLWVPVHSTEGIDDELIVFDGERRAAADVTHPKYEAFLREQIRKLVVEAGVDGFKEDWLSGITLSPGVRRYGNLHGIEFLRRFQYIVYDETHRWKPDAMVETQTPNALFRESSDVLRLNDIWYGTRGVPEMMRLRARIAHIAGWPLVDCDNASSTTLAEWWDYMVAQPEIGIPSLYFVHATETTFEKVADWQWAYLAGLWQQYLENNGLG